MSITLKTEGRRTYFTGETYPHREAIRAIGAHWDADKKMWWTAKRSEAEALVASISAAAPPPGSNATTTQNAAPGEDAIVAGKAEYKGHTYYIAGRTVRGSTHWKDSVALVTSKDGGKILLYARDGSMQFWAVRSDVRITSEYSKPKSIRGLRDYAERLRKSGDTPELDACRRRGWDGKIGSPSYYSSGAFDELDW